MIDIILALFNESSKMDLVILALIAFIVFGNGASKIRKMVKLKRKPDIDYEAEILKGEKIGEIKYRSTVYEQMARVRTVSDYIKMLVIKNFAQDIEKLEISDKKKSDAKILYTGVIKWAMDEACGYLRKWVKNNHFAEMSDIAFQEYIQKRSEEVQEIVAMEIDKYYLDSIFHIKRIDIRTSNEINCLPKITPIVSKLFIEIRAIAEEKQAEIEAIRNGDV